MIEILLEPVCTENRKAIQYFFGTIQAEPLHLISETCMISIRLMSASLAACGKKDNTTYDLLLCIFLGTLGVHRFYEGKIRTGILWLCALGLGGIGCHDAEDFCRLANPEEVFITFFHHGSTILYKKILNCTHGMIYNVTD